MLPHPPLDYVSNNLDYAFAGFAGPLLPFGTPVWKPFLNFRGISFKDRIRPVPVVFLLLAFMPQLSVLLRVLANPDCVTRNGSGFAVGVQCWNWGAYIVGS